MYGDAGPRRFCFRFVGIGATVTTSSRAADRLLCQQLINVSIEVGTRWCFKNVLGVWLRTNTDASTYNNTNKTEPSISRSSRCSLLKVRARYRSALYQHTPHMVQAYPRWGKSTFHRSQPMVRGCIYLKGSTPTPRKYSLTHSLAMCTNAHKHTHIFRPP